MLLVGLSLVQKIDETAATNATTSKTFSTIFRVTLTAILTIV